MGVMLFRENLARVSVRNVGTARPLATGGPSMAHVGRLFPEGRQLEARLWCSQGCRQGFPEGFLGRLPDKRQCSQAQPGGLPGGLSPGPPGRRLQGKRQFGFGKEVGLLHSGASHSSPFAARPIVIDELRRRRFRYGARLLSEHLPHARHRMCIASLGLRAFLPHRA